MSRENAPDLRSRRGGWWWFAGLPVGALILSGAVASSADAQSSWEPSVSLAAAPKAGVLEKSRQQRPAKERRKSGSKRKVASRAVVRAPQPTPVADVVTKTISSVVPAAVPSQPASPTVLVAAPPQVAAADVPSQVSAATEVPPPTSRPTPAAAPGAEQSAASRLEVEKVVEKFCAGIVPTAIEARVAWQQKVVAELEKEIEERVVRLEAKIAEHRKWLSMREEFATKVGKNLTQLVAKMNPEAAAQQISEMDENTAAALIMKLDPKVAAPMLSEVQPAKAARLSSILAAASGLNERRAAAAAASAVSAPAEVAPGGNP